MDKKKKATKNLLWRDSFQGGTGGTTNRSFWRVHDGHWGRTLLLEIRKSNIGGSAQASILEGSTWNSFLDLKGEDTRGELEEQEGLLLERIALVMNWKLK